MSSLREGVPRVRVWPNARYPRSGPRRAPTAERSIYYPDYLYVQGPVVGCYTYVPKDMPFEEREKIGQLLLDIVHARGVG